MRFCCALACDLQDERERIFFDAEEEMRKILEENILNRFLASVEYARVVNGDGDGVVCGE